MTEQEPTQRTRYWLDFLYPSALVINAGIVATVIVMPWAPYPYKVAAGVLAIVILTAGIFKARQFRRRYNLQARAVR